MAKPSSLATLLFQRRRFIVDSDFQVRYTMSMLVAWTVCSLAFGFLLAATLLRAHSDPGAKLDVTRVALLLGACAAMVAVLFSLGIFFTHRISGPIFVMSRALNEILQGNLPRLRKLRRSDEFQVFFQRFNETIEHLRTREQDEAARLEAALEQLRPLVSGPGAAQEALADLAALVKAKHAMAQPAIQTLTEPEPASPAKRVLLT